MIKSNLEKLVEVAVSGGAAQPCARKGERVAYDGGSILPACFSGINFSVKVGDPAFDWAGAEGVEPGVAIENCCDEANSGLVFMACVGNEALIVNAAQEGKDKLKGMTGTVTGKTSCGRVLVHFPKRIVDKLCVGDTIQVRAGGQGMALPDYPDVKCMNLSPRLLKALNPSEKGGQVRVPVTKLIPASLMGKGTGDTLPYAGDIDIQASSPDEVKKLALDQLRLGDIVAIKQYDATHGGRYHAPAVTVGVVVHGAGRKAGTGPGVNVLMTSPSGAIDAIITRKANLTELLGLQ
jgi:hypothetical protein